MSSSAHCPPQGGSGQINTHGRAKDDVMPTVAGPEIMAEHAAAIFATSNQGLSKKARTEQRSQICQFINFLFEDYPSIYEECTVIMSAE